MSKPLGLISVNRLALFLGSPAVDVLWTFLFHISCRRTVMSTDALNIQII